jgi:hypothetical protein
MNLHPECATENIEGQEQEDTSMSSKVKRKKMTKATKRAERTARAGEPRKCSVCKGFGHNARSHLSGGLLA